jgi:hypothetical protein
MIVDTARWNAAQSTGLDLQRVVASSSRGKIFSRSDDHSAIVAGADTRASPD